MCDACENLLHPASTRRDVPDPAPIDRRRLLRQAGVGGLVALAAAIGLPDILAEAMAPPFETLQLGEDRRPALAVAAPGALAATSGGVPSLLPGVPAAKKSHHSSGISTPHVVTRAEWGADESIRTSARGFAPIRKFVVHHTASPNNPRHPVAVMQEMYQYHVLGRGFSDVGYNFAIDQHGTIYEARWARNYAPGELHDGEDAYGFGVVGAHALGVNAGSCGIVLIGDFTKGRPTRSALASLIRLISWKAARHRVDPLRKEEYISIYGLHRIFPNIAGHRQTGQTACPGGYLFSQLPWVREQVAARTGRFPANTIDMSKALRWTDGSSRTLASSVAAITSGTGSRGSVTSASPTGAKLTGYRLLTEDGRVITLGHAARFGSPRDKGLDVGRAIAGVPGRSWYLTSDPAGRVVGFGGAPGASPKASIQAVDVASTPSGRGHWVLTRLGGVYAYGTARHQGSLARSGIRVGARKIRSSPSGFGYWILGADGRVYAFGDARRVTAASTAGAVDFWPTPTGHGHWILLADGRVWAVGDADHFGDVPSLGVRWTKAAVALIGMPSGRGYAIASSDGGIFNFGSSPFRGSLGGSGRHVVGMAVAFG